MSKSSRSVNTSQRAAEGGKRYGYEAEWTCEGNPKGIPSRCDVCTRYSTDMCQHIASASAMQMNMGGTAGSSLVPLFVGTGLFLLYLYGLVRMI